MQLAQCKSRSCSECVLTDRTGFWRYIGGMPTFLRITPMIPTGGSLGDALHFYTEQMGFQILWQSGNGAGIYRDDVSFNLVENSNREWADNSSYSIGVSGLDKL